MDAIGFAPIFKLTRGGILESLHFGAAAVVDVNGKLLAAVGDPYFKAFMRSTAKPFQAIPMVEHQVHEKFGFTLKETALTCASHIGTDDHVQTAETIQAKAGFPESALQCGIHEAGHKETRRRMQLAGDEPTENRNNCSGKHSGMLAFAKAMKWPLDTYLELDHPLQREILENLALLCGVAVEAITVGIDGCSAPNFSLPLYNAALGLARLVDPSGIKSSKADACSTITKAMLAHPEMVAGNGRFDTRLMQVGKGKIVSKGGAEGYHGIGLMPGTLGEGSPGVGIAVKISDGAARSVARSAASMEILRQIQALNEEQLAELSDFGPVITLKNHRGLEIGKGTPVFDCRTSSHGSK